MENMIILAGICSALAWSSSWLRLKRIAALEARKPTGDYWRDPGPAANALLRWHLDCYAAVEAGRACWLPFELEPESSWSDAKREVMGYLDGIAKRLAQERR
jgi:hypothetical protein